MKPQVRPRVERRAVAEDITEVGEGAGGSRVGQSVEANGEPSGARVGDDVGSGGEDGFEELACLLLVSRKEGLHETGQSALRAVGRELDGINEYLSLAFELNDLLRLAKAVERYPLGHGGGAGG